MDDAFLTLQAAAAIEESRTKRGAAEAFERIGPDNQIGDAGLVLERDKDNAVGAARALADQDEPGNRNTAVASLMLIWQGHEVGGHDEAFLLQFGAEKSERVALYRQPQGRVILDDMLAERHLGQQPRRKSFPCFGWI